MHDRRSRERHRVFPDTMIDAHGEGRDTLLRVAALSTVRPMASHRSCRPLVLYTLLACLCGACGGQSSESSTTDTTPTAGTEATSEPAADGSGAASLDTVCADTASEEITCEGDEDCPPPGRCFGGVCGEGESGGVAALMEDCAEDGTCPSGLACDGSSGVCRETCESHTDCLSGWYCDDGFCADCGDRED